MQIKNQIKYLILAAIIIYLILPKPALAQFIVYDPIVASILGSQDATASIFQVLVYIFLMYIIGLVALYSSAYILQYVIAHPEWLSVQHNAMVQAGWEFTSGLANLFIVLALIVIAFGFILKIESFQSKKALPRLIIVALLVNFSLVFVGALVDIANILFNTILFSAGNDLPLQVIETLGADAKTIVLNLLVWYAALVGAGMIPFAAGVLKYVFVLLIFSVVFIPNIITWAVQITLFFLVSGMFFLYAFLFAARVYIIQLLAILSPIFFLCWALPPLKKYWDEWFGHLMEWLFFGVILFFFLAIGLRATQFLMPESRIPPTFTLPLVGWFFIPDYFVYYFFLFVYLAVVAGWVTMRVMPQIAKVLIAQGTVMGAGIWKLAGVKLAKAMGRETARAVAESPKLRAWAEKAATEPIPKGLGVRASLKRPFWYMRQRTGEILGPRLQEFMLKESQKAEAELAGRGPAMKTAKFFSTPYTYSKRGILQSMYAEDDYEDALAIKGYHWKDYGDPKKNKEIRALFQLDKIYELSDTLGQRGIFRAATPDVAAEFRQQKYGETPEEAMKNILSAIKPEQILFQPLTVLMIPSYLKALMKYGKSVHYVAHASRFRETGEEPLERTIMELAREAKMKPSDYLQKTNPPLFDYMTSSLIGLGYINLPTLDREFYKQEFGITEIEKTIQDLKEELEEAKKAGDSMRMEELKRKIEDWKKEGAAEIPPEARDEELKDLIKEEIRKRKLKRDLGAKE